MSQLNLFLRVEHEIKPYVGKMLSLIFFVLQSAALAHLGSFPVNMEFHDVDQLLYLLLLAKYQDPFQLFDLFFLTNPVLYNENMILY